MKADALNPRELFGTTVHYEIPAFQRPYVWTLDDQWQPLWQDVRRVAEKVIAADGDEASLEAVGGHFLGAVVFKLMHDLLSSDDVDRMLDALRKAVRDRRSAAQHDTADHARRSP